MKITEINIDEKIYKEKYSGMSKSMIYYLLTAPNTYWVKNFKGERKASIENLAKDYGYEIEKTITYDPCYNPYTYNRTSSNTEKRKPDGFVIRFVKKAQ